MLKRKLCIMLSLLLVVSNLYIGGITISARTLSNDVRFADSRVGDVQNSQLFVAEGVSNRLAATAEPTATVDPDETEDPNATEDPDETEDPNATEDPDETDDPDETEEPEVTEDPDVTTEPTTVPTVAPTKAPADTTAPIISGVVDNGYYKSVTIYFSDNVGIKYAELNDVAISSGITISEEGEYIVSVSDLSDNMVEYNFIIDNTAPEILSSEDGEVYAEEIELEYDDDYQVASAKLNGVDVHIGYTVSAAGRYTLVITDAAGNTASSSFVIDKTNPSISGVADRKYYNNKSVTIKFSDANGIDSATLNDDDIKSGKKVTKEGKYNLIVTDKAGNEIDITFVIDRTKSTVKGITKGLLKKGKSLKITDKYGVKSIKLDGKTYKSGAAIKKTGTHTLIVLDKAGNKNKVKFKVVK